MVAGKKIIIESEARQSKIGDMYIYKERFRECYRESYWESYRDRVREIYREYC